MMAIEVEFGNLFEDKDDKLASARANSKWYPFLEAVSNKNKYREFAKIVDAANERKQKKMKQREMELIK